MSFNCDLAVGFDDVDLEEDFDPNKYDKKMHKVFDDNYYAREVQSIILLFLK